MTDDETTASEGETMTTNEREQALTEVSIRLRNIIEEVEASEGDTAPDAGRRLERIRQLAREGQDALDTVPRC